MSDAACDLPNAPDIAIPNIFPCSFGNNNTDTSTDSPTTTFYFVLQQAATLPLIATNRQHLLKVHTGMHSNIASVTSPSHPVDTG
jgi:hypothetical protein